MVVSKPVCPNLKLSPKLFTKHTWSCLPQLDPQVWILAVGRFLSEVGTGFTLFYAPIFFVNKVGLSATSVGFALGSASISGIFGRILGGSFADSPSWGRRRTLLLSAAIASIGSIVLAATQNFPTLVLGNLISGFGIGLYWPATEAVVADLTPPQNRREAFAVTRLADNLGLGMGIVLGGVLVATTGAYRQLFIIDAISFVVFFGVIYIAIKETHQTHPNQNIATKNPTSLQSSWIAALTDKRLLVFVLVNIIFTTYISQLHSTLPIYFKNCINFSETIISALFAWQLSLAIFCQLPISRILKRFTHPHALTISALLWACGFCCIWGCGITNPSTQLAWAALAQVLFALAIVSYTPSAAALVTDLAPASQRGVYFSMNSLCWAAGYSLGPPLGGWALDQQRVITNSYWLAVALSVVITITILQYLQRMLSTTQP